MLDPETRLALERYVDEHPPVHFWRPVLIRWGAAMIVGRVDFFAWLALFAWGLVPAAGWVRREWRVGRLLSDDVAIARELERIPWEDFRAVASAPAGTSAVRETADRAPG